MESLRWENLSFVPERAIALKVWVCLLVQIVSSNRHIPLKQSISSASSGETAKALQTRQTTTNMRSACRGIPDSASVRNRGQGDKCCFMAGNLERPLGMLVPQSRNLMSEGYSDIHPQLSTVNPTIEVLQPFDRKGLLLQELFVLLPSKQR